MKKKVQETIVVERDFCNICTKEITYRPSNAHHYERRIEVVRGLGSTKDFDAHEPCINKIIRNAFQKYIGAKRPK